MDVGVTELQKEAVRARNRTLGRSLDPLSLSAPLATQDFQLYAPI
jgi:hypothetical protein